MPQKVSSKYQITIEFCPSHTFNHVMAVVQVILKFELTSLSSLSFPVSELENRIFLSVLLQLVAHLTHEHCTMNFHLFCPADSL